MRVLMKRKFFAYEWGEENKVSMVLVTEACGNDVRMGSFSRSGAIWVVKRLGEVAVMRENQKLGNFLDRFR